MAAPEQFYTAPLTPENFFQITAEDGRQFNVPTQIFINTLDGRRDPGTYWLDEETGACVDTTAHVDPTVQLAEGVIIQGKTIVGPESRIGADTLIGRRVRIEDRVVLGSDCDVDNGTSIQRKVRIGDGTTIGAGVYIGSRATIRAGVQIGRKASVSARSYVAAGRVIKPREAYSNVSSDAHEPGWHDQHAMRKIG